MLYYVILGSLALEGVLGAPQQSSSKYDSKIINGTDAKPGQYPYQISLQYHGSHRCGGSILSSRWSLTAAHCVDGTNFNSLSILAGTILLSQGGVSRDVEKYVMHEDYDVRDNWRNDIALLKVSMPFEFNTYIQPIGLPLLFAEVEPRTPVTVTGWGVLETGGDSPDNLQAVDIVTFSDEECSIKLNDDIHASHICAGLPDGNKGECNGDSGGALQTNGVLVGVVSWSYKPCTKPPYQYGVYTQVSYYVDWIKLHI